MRKALALGFYPLLERYFETSSFILIFQSKFLHKSLKLFEKWHLEKKFLIRLLCYLMEIM